MANHDEIQLYHDLKGFLEASQRDDLKMAAMNAILQISNVHQLKQLIQLNGMISPTLIKHVSYPYPIGNKALQTLVYLSSTTNEHVSLQCIEALLSSGDDDDDDKKTYKKSALNRVVEIGITAAGSDNNDSSWKEKVNYSMALLANITRIEHGAVEFVGRTLPKEAISSSVASKLLPTTIKPRLELLLSRFLSESYINEQVQYHELDEDELKEAISKGENDPYQHFAAVLMNVTQIEAGRKFVMRIQHHHHHDNNETTSSVLQAILGQLKHSPNPIRRRGIAGTIKNCCLDTNSAWWLLQQVHIMKYILYPLSGPEDLTIDEKRGMDIDLWMEGPEKRRECDYYTRLYLVESILLLCATGRKSRETIRLARTYVILKFVDMVEEYEDISERINECIQYLRRDEEGTAEGSSDQMVEDAYKNTTTTTKAALPALPASSGSTTVQTGSREDDDDDDYDAVD